MSSRYLQALGIPGFVGVGLLLFCASFYVGTIAPMQTQLGSLTTEAKKLATALRSSASNNASAAPVETKAASGEINPVADAMEIIRRLNAAAETAAVTVDRTSYTTTEKDSVRRIEVSLPTKGGYLAIRSYLRDALTVGRDAQIDSLVLQRARATDAVLGADLKLSFELDAK